VTLQPADVLREGPDAGCGSIQKAANKVGARKMAALGVAEQMKFDAGIVLERSI